MTCKHCGEPVVSEIMLDWIHCDGFYHCNRGAATIAEPSSYYIVEKLLDEYYEL